MDPRDRFIHQVSKGKSFVDVGGLWGTVNERVSVAHAAGASELAMLDISPADGKWWPLFNERREALGVPPAREISGDLMTLAYADPTLRFDVVHCSGILYHIPDQFQLLRALRTITTGHLVLTSSITETHIANDAGQLDVPEGGALFLPALSAAERAVLKAHWWPTLAQHSLGLTTEIDRWDLTDFGPWWWLPTTQALMKMCEIAGFDVLEVEHLWNGHAATLMLAARADEAASRTSTAA
jgi:hypothetical protein